MPLPISIHNLFFIAILLQDDRWPNLQGPKRLYGQSPGNTELITFLRNRWERRGQRADSCQNFGAFQSMFPLLLPFSSAFLTDGAFLSTLIPSKPLYPSCSPFPISSGSQCDGLDGWRLELAPWRPTTGPSRACSANQHSWYLSSGWGQKLEELQRVDAKSLVLSLMA